MLNKTARGELELPEYEDELNIQEQRRLYETMKEDVNLHGVSLVVDSFFIVSDNSELKDMYDAKLLKEDIIEQAFIEKIHVDSIRDSINLVELENEELLKIIGDDLFIISFVIKQWTLELNTKKDIPITAPTSIKAITSKKAPATISKESKTKK